MENFEEKACLCALNRIFGFEPKIALALIGHLGSASEVFRIGTKELEDITGPYFKYRGRISRQAMEAEAEELLRLEKEGTRFYGWTEDDYPDILRECEDAPVGLYIRSSSPAKDLWRQNAGIAVVGTRDISPYGREWCSRIVRELALTHEKPAIVSGLAIGTDIEAHTTALDNGLPTIGVMATGPDMVYPWRHRHTAERMASSPGCALVTDYPPGTAPLAIHFLRRNRIIAGLSRATILVESKTRGGGMATCRLAFSYNRDVYALPGRVDDLRSQGCNLLIRQKIAEPITSTDSLMESLGMKLTKGRRKAEERAIASIFRDRISKEHMDRMEQILKVIHKERGITIEELSYRCASDYLTTSDAVHLLELEGFIDIDILQRCSINYKNA